MYRSHSIQSLLTTKIKRSVDPVQIRPSHKYVHYHYVYQRTLFDNHSQIVKTSYKNI